MKKQIATFLCILLLLAGGCTKKPNQPAATATPEATDPPALTNAQGGGAKLGYAVVLTAGGSASAGEKNGIAKTDAAICAVIVDADGVIRNCRIDALETEVSFSPEGKILTDPGKSFLTKQALGADYGLKKASAIGKEWNEQADAFAAGCIGKTAEEVRGIVLSETSAPADADLSASCTIAVAGYVDAVARAAEHAADSGASETDRLGIGVTTKLSEIRDASDSAAGTAEASCTYAFVTVGADGRVTACIVDASQIAVRFDPEGKIVTDLSAEIPTKNALGDDYGMKKASGIGKEWYEQAAAFAEYCTGRTAGELSGVALDESGMAADPDLKAGVTVHIGDFVSAVSKAADDAR